MAEKKKGSPLLGLLALLMLGAVVYSCAAGLGGPELTPEQQAAKDAAQKFQDALYRCRRETKERVPDPDGFETAPFDEWVVIPSEGTEGPESWTFEYRFKLRNGFGALVWSRARCTVEFIDGFWSVKDLTQL